jgi:hypothetical protein
MPHPRRSFSPEYGVEATHRVIDGNRRDPGVDADTEESVAAQQLAVYGDAAYGVGKPLPPLEDAGARIMTKVVPPPAPEGRFAKDRFDIDPARRGDLPRAVSVPMRPAKGGGGVAAFGTACADYAATGPKVERKIGHLMRHRRGGPPHSRARQHEGGRRPLPADRGGQPGPTRRARTTSSRGPKMAGRTSGTGKALPDSRFHIVTAHRASQRRRQPAESTSRPHQPPQHPQRSAVTTHPTKPFRHQRPPRRRIVT